MEDDYPNAEFGSPEPDKHPAPEEGKAANPDDPEISGVEATEKDDPRTPCERGQSDPETPMTRSSNPQNTGTNNKRRHQPNEPQGKRHQPDQSFSTEPPNPERGGTSVMQIPRMDAGQLLKEAQLKSSYATRLSCMITRALERVPEDDERHQSLTIAKDLVTGWAKELVDAQVVARAIRMGSYAEDPELQQQLTKDILSVTRDISTPTEVEAVLKMVEETLGTGNQKRGRGSSSPEEVETGTQDTALTRTTAPTTQVPTTAAERLQQAKTRARTSASTAAACIVINPAITTSSTTTPATPVVHTQLMPHTPISRPTERWEPRTGTPPRNVVWLDQPGPTTPTSGTDKATNNSGGTPFPTAMKLTNEQQQLSRYEVARKGYVRRNRTIVPNGAPDSGDEGQDDWDSTEWNQFKEYYFHTVNGGANNVETIPAPEMKAQRDRKLALVKQYVLENNCPTWAIAKRYAYANLDPVVSEDYVGGNDKSLSSSTKLIAKWSGKNPTEVIEYLNAIEALRRNSNWSFSTAIQRVRGRIDCVTNSEASNTIQGWAASKYVGYRTVTNVPVQHLTFWVYEYECMRLRLLLHFFQPAPEEKRRRAFRDFKITLPITPASIIQDKNQFNMRWTELAEVQASYSVAEVKSIAKRTLCSLKPIERAEQYMTKLEVTITARHHGRESQMTAEEVLDCWRDLMDTVGENTATALEDNLENNSSEAEESNTGSNSPTVAAGWGNSPRSKPPAPYNPGYQGTTPYEPSSPQQPRTTKLLYLPRILKGPGWTYNTEKGSIRFITNVNCEFCGLNGHYAERCPFRNEKGEFDINGVCGYCTAGDFHEGWQYRLKKFCYQLQGISQLEMEKIMRTCMTLVEAREQVPTPMFMRRA